ncbi:MAG: D-aminoacylase [Vicinamibacteria bacterium]|nr:D-aminoacylase [Vicinamibacteria bacterium]
MTRAFFVLIAIAGLLATPLAQQPPYDILITNGRVLDGSGNPWFAADIAISAGRIVAVGRIDGAKATRIIDAAGLVVAPGFIDVHSHAAEGLGGALNTAVPLLAQGITTVFINPDGGGPTDLTSQRTALEARGVGVNVAQFVPHGSVRGAVLGMADRAPAADELARMTALVRTGMEAGGVGLSSGLYYAPGSYATTEEVIALAKVAGEFGGVYSSHIRDEADFSIGVVASVQEVIRIADEAHLPGVVSHMKALGPAQWGLSVALTTRVEQARARGVQVYADQYPYDASGTGLSAALVPRWAQVGGPDEFARRLAGADRERIKAAIAENISRRGGPDTLVISGYAPDHALEGKSLAAVAAERSVAAVDLVVALLERGDGGLVSFNMSERDIAHIMRQRWTMTCTDGDLTAPGQGKPHPRGYGAFARKLGVYVRERDVVALADAVRSMTSLPAQVFGLKDRGVIRCGARADLVIFDPASVQDTATYASPQQLAEGMRFVLVNGVATIAVGKATGATPGRFLKPERQ